MTSITSTSIFLTLLSLTFAANLEVVHDEELLNLIRSENYVIVLFGKKQLCSCENFSERYFSKERLRAL